MPRKTRPPYSLRAKGNGWEIRATFEGKQTSHWFKGDEAGAHARAAEILAEKRQGTYVPPSRLTVADLLDQWQEVKAGDGLEPTTWRSRDYCARQFLKPAIGSLQVEKLTGLHLDRLYAKMAEDERGLSDSTRAQVHYVISACLSWAVKKRLIARNAAKDATAPKVEDNEQVVLTEDQTVVLIAAAEGSALHIPILLAAHTGMRVAEIAALEWDTIDLDRGLLEVRRSVQIVGKQVRENIPQVGKMKRKVGELNGHTRAKCPKNGKPRWVGLSPQLVDALRAEWERRQAASIEHQRVCLSPAGKPRTGSSISLAFRLLANRLGLRDIHFHSLRHGAATHLANANIHPSAAAAMLGHSSWRMTRKYTHPDTAALRAAAAALGSSLKPSLEPSLTGTVR